MVHPHRNLSSTEEIYSKELLLICGPVAGVGIVINIAAFCYVVWSPKIRLPLKITLFNLVGSDCMFLAGILMRVLLSLQVVSPNVSCPIITILLIVYAPVSYTAVLGMAVYNYIAVFRGIAFNAIVTARKTVGITVVFWAVFVLVATVNVVMEGQNYDPACSLFTLTSPAFLTSLAGYMLVCSCGMAALNIAVAWKLRSTRFVGSVSSKTMSTLDVPASGGSSADQTPALDMLAHGDSSPQLLSVSSLTASYSSSRQLTGTNTGKVKPEHPYLRPVVSAVAQFPPLEPRSPIITSNTSLRENFFESEQRLEFAASSSQRVEKSVTYSAPLQNNTPVSYNDEEVKKTYAKSPDIPIIKVYPPSQAIMRQTPSGVTKGSPSWFRRDAYEDTRSRSDEEGQRCAKKRNQSERRRSYNLSPRMRTTVVTLAILAFWNALLTLPMLCMWVWMSTTEGIFKHPAYSGISHTVTFLALLNPLTSPFFYAWRFVEWRRLCHSCCRHGGFNLPSVGPS